MNINPETIETIQSGIDSIYNEVFLEFHYSEMHDEKLSWILEKLNIASRNIDLVSEELRKKKIIKG